jgi:guanylate kinase
MLLYSVSRFVFLKPPSLEVLEVRLRERGTETEEALSQASSSKLVFLKSLFLDMLEARLRERGTETEESLSQASSSKSFS